MLFNEQQIEDFVSNFRQHLCDGKIKKSVLPNTADEYYHGIDQQDLEAILNVDKDSPLFVMSLLV